MINDSWKDINAECIRLTPTPMPLLMRILNLTWAIEVLYKGKDQYTNSQTETKEYVAVLLVNPIPLQVTIVLRINGDSRVFNKTWINV